MIKIVFVSFLLCLSVYLSFGKGKDSVKYDINDYMELQVRVDKDTVVFGDQLLVTAVFKNKTDSVALFFPRFRMYVLRNRLPEWGDAFIHFPDGKEGMLIDESMDFSTIGSITPHGAYEVMYLINVTEEFFWKGWNNLHLFYACNLRKNRSRRPSRFVPYDGPYEGKHHGRLQSNSFSLYVVDKE